METGKKKLVIPYIVLISLLALGMIGYLCNFHYAWPTWEDVIFFGVIFWIVTNYTSLITVCSITVSFKIPLLFVMALTLGPFWATMIGGVSGISSKSLKNGVDEFLFNQSMVILISGLSGLYLQQTFTGEIVPLLINFFIAGMIYSISNLVILTVIIYLSSDGDLPDKTFVYLFESFRGVAVSVLLGYLLYQIYLSYGKIALLVLMGSVLLLKNLIMTYFNQHNNFFQLINSFMRVIDAKDHYTTDHCNRVSQYTADLAKALGFNRLKIAKLVQIARLHDVGKIWIPDLILNKPGKLTKEEYEIVKLHSLKGMELLSEIKSFKDYLPIVRYHHERYDGTGYPDNLKGEAIPIEARLLAVCDAFDVMTYGRIYKPPMTKREVIEELKICSGSQFDPGVVKVLLKLIIDGKYDHLMIREKEEKHA